jgi:hypothetical protein
MESEQISELATALAKAQSTMGPAIINKQNPHFRNRYADLAAVFEAIRKPLTDNGLSITQTTELRDGAFILRTTLRHSTGQWIASEYPLPLNAKPQELGSALTYGRRYELSAIVGVAADDDDDGEATRKPNGKGRGEETGEVITPEQIQTLTAALKVREIDEKEWLKRANGALKMKMESVADIPIEHFQRCLDNVRLAGEPQ